MRNKAISILLGSLIIVLSFPFYVISVIHSIIIHGWSYGKSRYEDTCDFIEENLG